MGLQGANKMPDLANQCFFFIYFYLIESIHHSIHIHCNRNPLDGFPSFFMQFAKIQGKVSNAGELARPRNFFGRLNPKKSGKKQNVG
jgi:hypothetical protein